MIMQAMRHPLRYDAEHFKRHKAAHDAEQEWFAERGATHTPTPGPSGDTTNGAAGDARASGGHMNVPLSAA